MTDLRPIGRDKDGALVYVDHDPDATYSGMQYADGRAYTGWAEPDHVTDDIDCWCGPTTEAVFRDDGSCGWVVTHNRYDWKGEAP